jgi:hypothetical protein
MTKEVPHKACMLMIIVVATFTVAIITVRLYHLFMPPTWCWLDEARIQALDKFFFSGTIGALLTSFLKKSFSTKEE